MNNSAASLRIFLAEYQGNHSLYVEACYQSYLSFWNEQPLFQGFPLKRHGHLGEQNREVSFWGIVEGHDDTRVFSSLERYEKLPCLKYLIDGANNGNADVKWYLIRKNGHVRVCLFSQQHSYLMVLQRQGSAYSFVTAHPLNPRQLQKKLKDYAEWQLNPAEPL